MTYKTYVMTAHELIPGFWTEDWEFNPFYMEERLSHSYVTKTWSDEDVLLDTSSTHMGVDFTADDSFMCYISADLTQRSMGDVKADAGL